ncbi:MAG: cation transporter [Gammaproteobacteria bacterium SG8_47]|nr:MAG: cation transporter [Gammaproteobacteria bacterium SG8_47]
MDQAPHHSGHYHPAVAKPGERTRYQETRKVTLVGAVVNVVLAIAKIVFGLIGQSQSLIADGVHSLSDLGSDILVLVASKHGSKDADEDHPYGHARIETAVTVGLGVLLLLVAAGLTWDAVRRLFEPDRLLHPGWLALSVAVVSVLSKEVLYHYTLRVAKRVRSNLLRANAWHHRSDAISSVVVIVGIAGTMAGLEYLDAIAAAGVAFMIAKIGWELSWHSIKELVDTGLDPERVEVIRATILGVDGVRALHMLRTRRMGPDALVDVHILVDPKLSVSEGHHISETVRARLVRKIDEVTDVMVHIDPEDDEKAPPSLKLPLRTELLEALEERWSHIDATRHIDKVTMHFLDGKVQVVLLLPMTVLAGATDKEALCRAFAEVAKEVDLVSDISLHFH